MVDSKLKIVSNILYSELAERGIKCKNFPSLLAYQEGPRTVRQIKLETLGQLQRHFGLGVYQIFVTQPEVSLIEHNTFKVVALSITIEHEGNGIWNEPIIQTEYEEIPRGYTKKNFEAKANKRAKKIAKKMKNVMDFIFIVYKSMNA